MKSILYILIFSSSVCFVSCENKPESIENIFSKEQFDPAIVNDFNLYDSLKNIIITNKDTILNYRDAKEVAVNRGNQNSDTTKTETYFFIYIFGKGTSSNQICTETIPPFIFNSIDKIFKKLGPDKIIGFDLSRNSSIIEITLKNFREADYSVETAHVLDWQWDHRNQHVPFTKDTLLAPGWIYYISCEKDNRF